MTFWQNPPADPFVLFRDWYESAQSAGNFEPTSMTLATVDSAGLPDARIVLLKGYSDEGLVFFTNYESEKSHELVENPKAALVFHWQYPQHRQIRVRGTVEKVSDQESNEYFLSRPRGSQLGAWASPQSQPIQSRDELLQRLKSVEEKFVNQDVARPPHWGGWRIRPLSMEFWQEEPFRLHNRLFYGLQKNCWTTSRLAP